MKKLIILSTVFIVCAGGFLRAQDARRIIENANDVIDFHSSEMVTTLKIYDDKGNSRIRQVANATNRFGETTKTLIKFLPPADVKGTTLLIYDYENKDDDLWIYLPALRKSRRLISSEKGKSFMGSEFSNADMSKPSLEDFNYRLIGSENLNGIDCWKLESQCKNEEIESKSGFTRKISWIEKGTFLTRKVEYFNGKEIPGKVMSMSDYRQQADGKYFAFKMEMKNLLSNRWSEIIIDKFQQGSQMAETSFAVSALGN